MKKKQDTKKKTEQKKPHSDVNPTITAAKGKKRLKEYNRKSMVEISLSNGKNNNEVHVSNIFSFSIRPIIYK